MQDAFIWGSLIIKHSYIAFAFSAFAAYIAAKYWLKDMNQLSSPLLDDLSNISFWALLIWKFSVVLFNPLDVFTNPYYLLYFNGGQRGIWLAGIVGLIFLVIQSRKRKISGSIYAAAVASGFLAYKLTYSLFQLLLDSTMQTLLYDLSQVVIPIILLIWLYLNKKNFRKPQEIYQLVLWFSIGQIFSHYLSSTHTAKFVGLSSEQLIFLALALFCLFIQNFRNKCSFTVS